MDVFLNHRQYSFEKEINLTSFLTEIKIGSVVGIAIAINEMVIPKSEWDNTIINDNDKIILIKATAGG